MDQTQYSYPSLPNFIMPELWLHGAGKNAALQHCCQVPKSKDASTNTALLQINLP